MVLHLTTFATEDMSISSQRCIDSSKEHGLETHSRYNPGNMMHCASMSEYKPIMEQMFKHQRGAGYWFWKPLIIKSDMEFMSDGDHIVYADAGVEFIDNIRYIIDRMEQDIFLFGNNWEHAHWCKRDIVDEVWKFPNDYPADGYYRAHPWEMFGKQVQASVIIFRVSDYTREFVKEWLDWCLFECGRLIDDSSSRTTNHPEFRENRHDQAILTTMAYREGIKLHWWPAQYEGGRVYDRLPQYYADNYPVLFYHHRKRNHEWQQVA